MYSFYEMNYLVLVEIGSFEGKRHKFVRFYRRVGDSYEPFSLIDPFGDKVSANALRVYYCASTRKFVISVEREDFESMVAFISNPFPQLVSAEAVLPAKKEPKPSRVGPNGVQVFDIDCLFSKLELTFEEPMWSSFQSDLEDFGIIALQDENKLEWICLYNPSTKKFFKSLRFTGPDFEKFKLHYAVKVFGEDKILVASRVSANISEKREIFLVDYNTGSAS